MVAYANVIQQTKTQNAVDITPLGGAKVHDTYWVLHYKTKEKYYKNGDDLQLKSRII